MARYKPYDYGQMKLLPVSFAEQIHAFLQQHATAFVAGIRAAGEV